VPSQLQIFPIPRSGPTAPIMERSCTSVTKLCHAYARANACAHRHALLCDATMRSGIGKVISESSGFQPRVIVPRSLSFHRDTRFRARPSPAGRRFPYARCNGTISARIPSHYFPAALKQTAPLARTANGYRDEGGIPRARNGACDERCLISGRFADEGNDSIRRCRLIRSAMRSLFRDTS